MRFIVYITLTTRHAMLITQNHSFRIIMNAISTSCSDVQMGFLDCCYWVSKEQKQESLNGQFILFYNNFSWLRVKKKAMWCLSTRNQFVLVTSYNFFCIALRSALFLFSTLLLITLTQTWECRVVDGQNSHALRWNHYLRQWTQTMKKLSSKGDLRRWTLYAAWVPLPSFPFFFVHSLCQTTPDPSSWMKNPHRVKN